MGASCATSKIRTVMPYTEGVYTVGRFKLMEFLCLEGGVETDREADRSDNWRILEVCVDLEVCVGGFKS